MHQFWHTVSLDSSTQTYSFMLDDQIFEVGADLLHDALQINPKDPDHPFIKPSPHDEIHEIKLDAVLGNLKFVNKGEEHPIYGMAILKEMMSDTIKKGIEVVVQKKETIRETKVDEEERQLNERHSSLVIGREVNKETDEGTPVYTTMKLKGVKNVSCTIQFLLDMKKASKESKNKYILQQCPKGPGEGSSVVPDTPDDQSDSFGSSHSGSDDEEGFLQTNDKELKDKSDNERIETDKSHEDAGKKKDEKIQVLVPELEKKKPEVPPPSPSQTLSSAEYGNQLLNDNVHISMNDILCSTFTKKVDAGVVLQRLMKLEKKVEEMSKNDHTKAIDKSVQAHLMKVLLKDVPNF
ncbi:hypothetical protein Tco_1416036, partial [Tanacetum coccineum]